MRRAFGRAWVVALVATLGSAEARADRVVLEDGTVLEGTTTLDTAANEVVVTTVRGGLPTRKKVPLSTCFAIEGPDGTLTWLRGSARLRPALTALADARERDRLLALAADAAAAQDAPLVRRLVDRATALGATGSKVESLRKLAAGLEARKAQPKADACDRIAKAVEAFPRERAAYLWERASATWKDLSEGERDAFADLVLSLDASHAGAAAHLESQVPEALRARVKASEWRGWKKVLGAGTQLRFPPSDRAPEKGLSELDKELGRAAFTWQKDVVGIEGEGWLVVARPPARPALEEAVATTRALVAYLEALFRTDVKRRAPPTHVVVYVHGDRRDLVAGMSRAERERSHRFGVDIDVEEAWYGEQTGETEEEKKERLEAPLGFFDSDERVTRMHLPDAGRTERMRRRLARLLVTHWFVARCPRFIETDYASNSDSPSAWVTNAFDDAIAEGKVDASGAWTFPPPKSAEHVKLLIEGGLTMPWDKVFAASSREVSAFDTEWRKGRAGISATELTAWWEQATATVHYLLEADNGAYHRRLADHVVAGWVGPPSRMSVDAAYGLTAEALGARVEEWARRRAPPPTPTKGK